MKLIIYRLEHIGVEQFFVELELTPEKVYRVTRSKGGRLQFFTKDEMETYIKSLGDVVRMQGAEIVYRNGNDYYVPEPEWP